MMPGSRAGADCGAAQVGGARVGFLIRWAAKNSVVFRSAERKDGGLLAARILKAVNSAISIWGTGDGYGVVLSGVGRISVASADVFRISVEEVLRLADRGLYLAKNAGRNQAVGLQPDTELPRLARTPARRNTAAWSNCWRMA